MWSPLSLLTLIPLQWCPHSQRAPEQWPQGLWWHWTLRRSKGKRQAGAQFKKQSAQQSGPSNRAYLGVRKLENVLIGQIDQERVDTWRKNTYDRKQPKVELRGQTGEEPKVRKKSNWGDSNIKWKCVGAVDRPERRSSIIQLKKHNDRDTKLSLIRERRWSLDKSSN